MRTFSGLIQTAIILASTSLVLGRPEKIQGYARAQGDGFECASTSTAYTKALQACVTGSTLDPTCLCNSTNHSNLQGFLDCLSTGGDSTGIAGVGALDAANFNDVCKGKGLALITASGPVATAYIGTTLPGPGAGGAAPTATGAPAAAASGGASGSSPGTSDSSSGTSGSNSPSTPNTNSKSGGSASIETVGLSAMAALVLLPYAF